MEFIELQIIATVLSLTGQFFIMFKKKKGWLFQFVGIFFLIAVNYSAGLYFLITPCCISAVVLLSGWFKWRHDEKVRNKEVNK